MTVPATIEPMAARDLRTVLLVEDEPTIAEVVERYLIHAGYAARIAPDGLEALRIADEIDPDLVVLDVMLPRLDGLEVLRRLRSGAHARTPVIMLTARGEYDDRIAGLQRGADDYMVKPFSPRELVARVEAVLRRVEPPGGDEPQSLCFGELEIDPAARRLLRAGEEVQLSHREFELLNFLAAHPGQAFTREQLMDHVWESIDLADSGTVTVHVRRLRAKIEPDPERPTHLQTVWGHGYRFQP